MERAPRARRRGCREAGRPRQAHRRRPRRLPARARVALPAGARRHARAARLRERRDVPGGAAALRAAGRRRRDASPASPTASTSTRAVGSTHMDPLVERDARGRSRRSGSPSTATATGCSRWTPTGTKIDGDEIIAQIALDLKRRGELAGNGVAVTVMTNFGFHRRWRRAGIEVATTDVGDRHVVDELDQARLGARRRAVGPHRRHAAHALRRRHRGRAADCCRRSRARDAAVAAR